MSRVKARHDPECRIPHHPDLDCDEADRLGDSTGQTARGECSLAPSRTQPFHAFDDTDWSGECVYGCGVTRDRIGGDGDA